jgi:hypothetical protein
LSRLDFDVEARLDLDDGSSSRVVNSWLRKSESSTRLRSKRGLRIAMVLVPPDIDAGWKNTDRWI